MINYKEFEVIQTILKMELPVNDIAEEVYHKVHYYVFKSVDEVRELISSLEKKGYLSRNLLILDLDMY